MRKLKVLKDLPCYPCPHNAMCCSWGVSLSEDEYINLTIKFGDISIWDDQENEYRTKVIDGHCIFLKR